MVNRSESGDAARPGIGYNSHGGNTETAQKSVRGTARSPGPHPLTHPYPGLIYPQLRTDQTAILEAGLASQPPGSPPARLLPRPVPAGRTPRQTSRYRRANPLPWPTVAPGYSPWVICFLAGAVCGGLLALSVHVYTLLKPATNGVSVAVRVANGGGHVGSGAAAAHWPAVGGHGANSQRRQPT
ncbi:hypothetical protein Bbelb_098670 [Branchiostoma belcheri]|nr:hypothetical protein Bbelb_098670 [Branchiostoma belcheri]